MKLRSWYPLFATALLAMGCGDGARPMTAEERERRITSYRIACAARYVSEEAEQNEQILEAAFANIPAADSSARPGQGVIDFARALTQYASTRGNVYIYLDSAVNHAATPADSARYVQRAGTFVTRAPLPGTVEANVAANYERNLDAVMANEDHPCNWDLPF